jgi:hypothetical protein
MRKIRDDSTWNRLTSEQHDKLDSWLFEENLGYEKTLERVHREFGLKSTVASVGRYYRRRAPQRQAEEILDAQSHARLLNILPVNVEELRSAVIKILAKTTLKLATETPDDLSQLMSLVKLLLDSEENDLRRERLKLAEKCFDYDAIAACQKEWPHHKAALEAIGNDASLSYDEKIEKVKKMFFGWQYEEKGRENSPPPSGL